MHNTINYEPTKYKTNLKLSLWYKSIQPTIKRFLFKPTSLKTLGMLFDTFNYCATLL